MHVITLIATLVVVAALVSKLISQKPTVQLRPVRIKDRREQDRR